MCRIKWDRRCLDVIAERCEQPADNIDAATRWQGRDRCLQRDRPIGQLLTGLGSARHRSAQHAAEGYRQQRRGCVWPVIHVLILLPRRAAFPAHQFDRIDLKHDCGGAALFARFRVKERSATERQFGLVDIIRVLHQQEAEVACRLVRRRNGQQHLDALVYEKAPPKGLRKGWCDSRIIESSD